MKKLISVLLMLAVMVTLAVSISAVGEDMTAVKGTPTVDGTIDAIWDSAERVQLAHLKAGDLKGDGTLPETSSAYARMMWDETGMYFLFEVYDDDFAFWSTPGDWKNDAVYLYIDETSLMDATWQDGQYQIALIPEEDYSMFPRNGASLASYEFAYSYPSDGYCVIEFKFVPQVIELSELKEGFELLVDFQYNDGDDNMTRPYCFGWSDETDGASGNSNIWGFVTLGGAAAAPVVEEPVVEEPVVEEPVVEEPAVEEPAPVEEAVPEVLPDAVLVEEAAEEPAVEKVVVVEEPVVVSALVEETVTAPQTADAATVITLAAVVSSLCAFVISRKKVNA